MSRVAVSPFSPPEQIAADVYVVYGSIRFNPVIRFTRNMAVIRSGQDLTLINPVRMDDTGLAELERLGEVKHVLRLGPLHGLDDVFYVERYGAKFWSLPGGTTYTQPPMDHQLGEQEPLPFPGARMFVFRHMVEPEGALLLERGPGLLLTVDAIQSYATPPYRPHTNFMAKLLLPLLGFPKKTIIGPIWMKKLVTDREGIREEFMRLMALEFDQLLSAHGVFLPQGAKADVERAYDDMFGGA